MANAKIGKFDIATYAQMFCSWNRTSERPRERTQEIDQIDILINSQVWDVNWRYIFEKKNSDWKMKNIKIKFINTNMKSCEVLSRIELWSGPQWNSNKNSIVVYKKKNFTSIDEFVICSASFQWIYIGILHCLKRWIAVAVSTYKCSRNHSWEFEIFRFIVCPWCSNR